MVISWPDSATNYVLQQNPSLTNAAGWANYTGSVSDNGTNKTANIAAPSGTLFFRLKQ